METATNTSTSTPAKPLTRKQAADADKARACEMIRNYIGKGDYVYTMITHVARSGMSRHVRVLVAIVENGKPAILDLTHLTINALGERRAKNGDIVVGGVGFDAGYQIVLDLSHALFGRDSGYVLKHGRL